MTVHTSMTILTVVPARGGSKGIPKKNLHPFRGRPLIDYTLDVLTELWDLRPVLVSTDDDEIRAHCHAAGFATDYKRPDHLATDGAGIGDTLVHGLEWAEIAFATAFDYVLLLQPTSPLRLTSHVREFLQRLEDDRPESLVAVSPMTEHPMECLAVVDGIPGWRYLGDPPQGARGRQAYSGDYYFINGAIYAATPDFLRQERTFLVPSRTDLFEMDARYSLDIDTPDDLLR